MANSLAGRESLAPLPPDKLPLKGELYAILSGCHEAAVPVGCRSKVRPELPPKAAPTSDYEVFRDKSLCPVCPEDLRTKDRSNREVPPRAIQMRNLIKFFACGSLHAANRQPAIEYASRDVMQIIKPTFWQLHLPLERDATGGPQGRGSRQLLPVPISAETQQCGEFHVCRVVPAGQRYPLRGGFRDGE